MKSICFYPLFIFSAVLVIFLSSFQITKGRHLYRNQWKIPAHKNLKIKNSSKEIPEVVLYHPSQKDDLQYAINNHEIKELPKNDSVKVRVDFAREVFIVNNSAHEGLFRLKIINNTDRIKAALRDQLPL
ncbi:MULTISPECIES: hypothetical protein [unclassified Chryseobacterium]|uniref:hypothetical protein n=1 Tax=unclassified Chryseobacterium TaxID=2593645 RepID=UPI000917A416|nr:MULTISPECIES: hypothetical protein [unclassified Chryseobacterium]SHF41615.1 hypothetical protein SAMN02787100_1932 [Chryseobacterium sp. OV279]HCA06845.1 hypothetical protein [Chryseobacterium sp.]